VQVKKGQWFVVFCQQAFPVSSVRMMLNLDLWGAAPLTIPNGFHRGAHMNQKTFASGGMQPYMPPVTVFGTDYFASDHQAFIDKGIPVCLFTTGLHPHQQTLRDTPEMMDFSQMDAFCQYISAFIMEAANAPEDLFRFEKAPAPAGTGGDNPVFAYSEVDVQPRFLNADIQSFVDKWIYKYLEYPREAVKEGIRGRVMVSFIVEADGQITQVEVTRLCIPCLTTRLYAVISASPKWKPGEISGKKVRVKIVVPVYFELTRNR
jgi:TonB family protein